jgi:hypothetical protein
VANAIQLSLNNPEQFQTVPSGVNHYVVALQNKPGERDALLHASAQTWAHFTPLLQIVGPKDCGKEPFTHARFKAWVKTVAEPVGSHSCFLDVLQLPPNHPTATKEGNVPALSAIHAEARKRGMAFVPVLRLGDVRGTVQQISETIARDGRGVALRYALLGTAPAGGRSVPVLIKEALAAVDIDQKATDLIMDLGYLSEDVEIHAEDLVATVNELIGVGGWRSVVLLGTSMPSSLGGGIIEAGTVGRLLRREWVLWSALRATGMPRLPTYGDYAVQHPNPPAAIAEGQIPIGMRGSIRYTHDTKTVIPRAKAPRWEEGHEQYRELCKVLVNQPEFLGREFTWGDRQIAECADGTIEPGWERHWRGAGTSHHLGFVVDQLAKLT